MTAKELAHKVLWAEGDQGEENRRRPALAEVERGKVTGPTLRLEVTLKSGDVPLRFLGAVHRFAAGEMTLKLDGPASWMDWESLVGREASLHGEPLEAAQGMVIKGKVVRARKGEGADSRAVVVVALAKVRAKDLRALEARLLRPPKDIKGLWERWDKTQNRAAVAKVGSQSLYLFGLILLVAGLVMHSRQGFGYLPVLLMGAGGGIVAAKLLWSFFKK